MNESISPDPNLNEFAAAVPQTPSAAGRPRFSFCRQIQSF